jgi:RNA polymerase sigma-70 factor, ECF subfamily
MNPSYLEPVPPPGVERWLVDARGGSPEALGQLLEACRNYLLMVANRELDTQLQAKGGSSDLVQETFLEAQQHFARFHGRTEEELLTWLCTILHNNVANFRRRYWATEKREVAREVALDEVQKNDALQQALAADALTPSGVAMANEEAQTLERALQRLPDDYRRVIVLRQRDQLAFEEIGAMLGRTADASRKLWVRAIAQLQKELKSP